MLKPTIYFMQTGYNVPAAFGRLCVETPLTAFQLFREQTQPPSGGCVLKQVSREASIQTGSQPPSGGCVLKQPFVILGAGYTGPAAFGRLCVETGNMAR